MSDNSQDCVGWLSLLTTTPFHFILPREENSNSSNCNSTYNTNADEKNKTFFTFTLPSFSCVFVPFQILTSFFSTYFSSLLSFNKCLLRMVMVWRWWRWLGDVYTHTRCSLLFIHLYTIYIYNMACCCHKVTSLFHTFHKEKRREGKKKSRKRVFRCSYNFVISTKNERTKREWKKKRARRSMKDFFSSSSVQLLGLVYYLCDNSMTGRKRHAKLTWFFSLPIYTAAYTTGRFYVNLWWDADDDDNDDRGNLYKVLGQHYHHKKWNFSSFLSLFPFV